MSNLRTQLRLQQLSGSVDGSVTVSDDLASGQDILDQLARALRDVRGSTTAFTTAQVSILNDAGGQARISYVNGGDTILKNDAGTDALTIDASTGNVTIAGDLTVSGDTTTLNTATLTVEDPIILMGKGNAAADTDTDLGLVMESDPTMAKSFDIQLAGSAAMGNLAAGHKVTISSDHLAADVVLTFVANGGAVGDTDIELGAGGTITSDTAVNILNKINAQNGLSVTGGTGGGGAVQGSDLGTGAPAIQILAVNTTNGASGRNMSIKITDNGGTNAVGGGFTLLIHKNSTGDVDIQNTAVPLNGDGTGGSVAGIDGSVGIVYDKGDNVLLFGFTGADASDTAAGAGFDKLATSNQGINSRFIGGGSIQFRQATEKISSDTAGVLDLAGATSVDVTSPAFVVGNGATNQGRIRFLEDEDNGTHYVQLQSPASLGDNVELTLPDSIPTGGGVLESDGSGNLSIVAASAAVQKRVANVSFQLAPDHVAPTTTLFHVSGDANAALNPAINSSDTDKLVDVFVNGQLLQSGSDAQVKAAIPTCDYHLEERTFATVKVTAAGAGTGTARLTGTGLAGNVDLVIGARDSSNNTAEEIAALLLTQVQGANGVNNAARAVLAADGVTIIIQDVPGIGTDLAFAGDAAGDTGITVAITQAATVQSPRFGFNLEADDIVTIIAR